MPVAAAAAAAAASAVVLWLQALSVRLAMINSSSHSMQAPWQHASTVSPCLSSPSPAWPPCCCRHIFCQGCIAAAVKATKKCPKCRKALRANQVHRIFLEDME